MSKKNLHHRRPPTHPQPDALADGGQAQLELAVSVTPTEADAIAGVYRALQAAVEKFGGIVELACATGKGKDEISRRVRRAEDTKGDTQRAFLDYLGFLNWEAREVFLAELAREWGYKRPELRTEATEAEQLRALKAELHAAGGVGEDVLTRAALRGGFAPNAFRR